MLRIGIDIGGTFTDFVVYDPINGQIYTFKLLSDPENPAETVLQGLKHIGSPEAAQIIHGSTVTTNALLERKGVRTALITTRGFKDVIQIGRQNRPNLYDWSAKPAPSLTPQDLRFEVDERVDHLGNVLIPVNSDQLEEIIKDLERNSIESVAVCFLFSFLYPQHEKNVAEMLQTRDYFISLSSEILPEYREYERTSTTVVNAYVSPILDRYLSKLEKSTPAANFQVMQSNGGMISLREARQNGVWCILSGPAGGISGAQNVAGSMSAQQPGDQPEKSIKLITFDMGGTSTDVSLIDGQPTFTTDASIGGCPIHLPLLDIHTIGAGGGSIAYVDPGGSLRVGPQSAGANPGPACYGKGDSPTVTDANLVLGRLIPDYFLGGQMKIFPNLARNALARMANSLNLTIPQAALGIIEVVNTQMEHALRVISVERGHDPRDFSLFAFGGAGGLHASELARRMGIPRVIISRFASTLSAYGMLASNVMKDYVRTVMSPATTTMEDIEDLYFSMVEQAKVEIRLEGFPDDLVEIRRNLDIRYVGQSYEVSIPFSKDFIEVFYKSHRQMYGYYYQDKPVEIVNLRVTAIGKVTPISQKNIKHDSKPTGPSLIGHKQVEFAEGSASLPVYRFENLLPGGRFDGPAIIVSADTTILVNRKDQVFIDPDQNLLLDVFSDN
jgi:N-methylhydantoinase A